MAQKRKYGSYVKMYKVLKKDGFAKPGPVVMLLLDAFLERKGTILEEHCVIAGVLGSLKFSEFRRKLEDHNWLVYDKSWAIQTKRFAEHLPGTKLVPFINIERMKLKEMATLDDLREQELRIDKKLDEKVDKVEFQKALSRLEALETQIIKIMDPPDSPEKRTYYAKNPQALLKLVAGEKPNG